jgi:mono/diheme cytochrome c family protein
VMLADYAHWLPGEKITPKNFDLPGQCVAPDKAIRPPGHGDNLANASCSDCHTTPW